MIRILLQTTIPAVDDDWNIRRYSPLRGCLASLEDERGEPLFAVTARDREPDARGDDPMLSGLADSDFDEIWLFGADTGNGLSGRDCAGIFADYNGETDAGCPSRVAEAPGDAMKLNPRALADIQAYVGNAALWLAGHR